MDLKTIRKRMGLTQAAVAKAIGATAATVCRYENGKRLPSVKTAKRLARVLDIDDWRKIYDTDDG